MGPMGMGTRFSGVDDAQPLERRGASQQQPVVWLDKIKGRCQPDLFIFQWQSCNALNRDQPIEFDLQ